MKRNKGMWFKARKNGYGWLPVTWQAYAILMVWVAIFAGFVAWANMAFANVWLAMGISILFGGFWLGVLYGVATMKGEKSQATANDAAESRERQS